MGRPDFLTSKNIEIQNPSYIEYRGDRALLIWSELPFWLVCDKESAVLIKLAEKENNTSRLYDNFKHEFPESRVSYNEFIEFLTYLDDRGLIKKPGSLTEDVIKDNSGTELKKIENVTINITNKCNLNCITCYNQPLDHGRDEISAIEIDKLLSSLKPYIKKGATFAVLGGEPLLRPKETIEFCKVAKKFGLVPIISTNGTLITDSFAKMVKRYNIELQISMDGATEKTNDHIRGHGVFKKIKQNVKICNKRKVHTILSIVICDLNLSELESFIKLGKIWGVSEVRFITMKRIGKGKDESITIPTHIEIIKRVADFLKNNKGYKKYLVRDYFTILAMHCTLCNKRDYCGTGQQTIFLDADGSLYPCPNHCYNQFKFGNIFNHGYNLIDLWEKSPILDKLRKQYNIHDLNETCSTCIVRNWCTGGCRGESFAVTGKLDAPAPDCNESRDAIIEMMWILGEHPFLKPFKAKEEHF